MRRPTRPLAPEPRAGRARRRLPAQPPLRRVVPLPGPCPQAAGRAGWRAVANLPRDKGGSNVPGRPLVGGAKIAGDAAENLPVQVNGILGGSASFPLKLPETKPVASVEWSLQAGSGPEMLIAELKDGKLEWQNTLAQLRQRLEMADGTTLRIRALEKEDSCTLKTLVVFASGEVLRQTFHLSVFEPVPDPEIRPHLVSRTAEVCNVTLQCLASEKGEIEVSWKRGNQLGVLEEGSDRYRLSANGMDLHISWHPNSPDSIFTCLLSNPADQKSALLDVASICRSEDDSHHHLWNVWILALVPFLFLVAALGVWQWKKRPCPRAFPLTKPVKRDPPEYAAVQEKRIPPEGDDEQDPDRFSPCLPENPMLTPLLTSIYATLQNSCSER